MIDDDPEARRVDGGPAPWVFDVLLGIGVTLTVSLFIAADVGENEPDGWAYLWAAGLGALMLARRRYPVIVVLLSAGGVISYYAAGYPPIGVAVPLAAAVFSAAEYGRIGAAIAASAAVIAISVVYRLAVGQDPALVVYDLPGHALLLAGAVAFGDSVRSRRELRRKSEQIAELTVERYARAAEQRVMAERLEIARELHDSVGHALTVVTLHTQVIEEALGSDDAEVRRSLDAIADTTTATFADVRRTVASLRKGGVPSRSPLRISDLESAALPARQAGIDVRIRVGLRSTPSPTVEAAVYRIVQESITNVVRHAAASRVDVDIEEGDDGMLDVSVVDDGKGSEKAAPHPPADHGTGLAGMRERAHLLGGTFSAERRGSGFAVKASIPMEVVER
ncbi:sensor histidine kinase [Microbacterium sp. ProA8]|jgi:signal transduction histidine kinase|uniref:sensor histidine kinase n=1 Tax=Microbacterium chionoecetis TaxID=3153754 RepID=UPI003267BEF3